MSIFSFLNPVSAIGSVIGGIQGASASHHAADVIGAGYQNAANTVNTAVGNANPIIGNAADTASARLTGTAADVNANVATTAGRAGGLAAGALSGAEGYVNPYLQTGAQANAQLQALTAPGADVTSLMQQLDPGYNFRLSQGLQGVEQSQAASGLLKSGATGRALTQYGQNYASNEYQNTYNRLAGLAGMGLGAGQYLGSLGMGAAQYAGNTGLNAAEFGGNAMLGAAGQAGQWGVGAGMAQAGNLINAGYYTGNTQIQQGNAKAQGILGAANGWNGLINGVSGSVNPTGSGFGFGQPSNGGWGYGPPNSQGAYGPVFNYPQPVNPATGGDIWKG